jgi:hypothetical protein
MPKLLKSVSLEDRLEIPSQRKLTDAGQMIVPCAFARTGPQAYSALSLGVTDAEEGEVIQVFRDESEVFSDESMESFRSSPVTIGHPMMDGKAVLVTADNAATFQKGMLEGMPVRDEDTLAGTLVITDQEAIDAIESGDRELSAGYTCDLMVEDTDDGIKYSQTNIRANHIAIVTKGRAGSSCVIADEADPKEEIEAEAAAAEKAADEILETLEETVDEPEVTKDEAESVMIYDQAMFDKALVKEVRAKVSVIVKASEYISDDVSDMSVVDIQKLVIAKVTPKISLDDKSDEYLSARFDIIFEDDNRETPMSILLRQANTAVIVEDAKDEVEEARKRSVARNSKKEG